MASSLETRVVCPACGVKYKWDPEFAGRKIKCKCGEILRLPKAAGAPATVEPAQSTASSASKAVFPSAERPCPSCGSTVKSGAVICLNCGFHLAEGKKLQTAVVGADDAPGAPAAGPKPAPLSSPWLQQQLSRVSKTAAEQEAFDRREARRLVFIETYVPLILITIGLGLILLDVFVTFPKYGAHWYPATWTPGEIKMSGAIQTGLVLGIQIPCLVLGIFAVAKIFGSSFGPFLRAMLKLLALGIVTTGVNACFGSLLSGMTQGLPVPGAGQIKFAVSFGVFWALSASLFEMEVMESLVLYGITVFLPIMAALLLMTVF
jgi:hypothetical protein